MSTRARADLALVLISLLWGSSFVVMKDALAEASTVLLLALRFTAATAMLATLELGRWRRVPRQGLGWITLAGVLLAAAYVLQTTGLRYTTAGKSAFLTGLYIVAAPLLSAAFLRTPPRLFDWAGVGIATAGMALMNSEGLTLTLGLGEWLTVGCAILFAAHLLVLGRAVRELEARHAGLLQLAICSAALWLALPVLESPRATWSPRLWIAVGVTASLATALPFTLLSWAQKHTPAVRAGLLMSLEMPFAGLAAGLVLGERMNGKAALGAALIFVGVVVVEWASAKAAAPSPPPA